MYFLKITMTVFKELGISNGFFDLMHISLVTNFSLTNGSTNFSERIFYAIQLTFGISIGPIFLVRSTEQQIRFRFR